MVSCVLTDRLAVSYVLFRVGVSKTSTRKAQVNNLISSHNKDHSEDCIISLNLPV